MVVVFGRPVRRCREYHWNYRTRQLMMCGRETVFMQTNGSGGGK